MGESWQPSRSLLGLAPARFLARFAFAFVAGLADAGPHHLNSVHGGGNRRGTGLRYYRARYYHAGLQQFISEGLPAAMLTAKAVSATIQSCGLILSGSSRPVPTASALDYFSLSR